MGAVRVTWALGFESWGDVRGSQVWCNKVARGSKLVGLAKSLM